MTSRSVDNNGYITIARNPISRSGIFQYLGSQLPGGDPDRVYNVYRPEEEFSDPEALASFRMIPLINDHAMLGAGQLPAEQKGIHGSTGEEISFEDGVLYSNLRIFSKTLQDLVGAGKKALSVGMRCVFEKSSGVFDGQAYDYVQRKLRGNHLALVIEGRAGPEISVLDHTIAFDHFDLTLDKGDDKMADEAEKTEAKSGMTLEEACAVLNEIVPMVKKLTEAMASTDKGADTPAENAALDEDTKEKDGDTKEKAEDADDKEKDKAMDAIEARLKRVEGRTEKDLLASLAKRESIARQVAEVVGTFDYAAMDAADIVSYGIKKLGLTAAAGQERGTLEGYLAGRKATGTKATFAMDGQVKKSGLLEKRLTGQKGV